MRRGDVFDARLDPVEGSEQAGIRPVVVVSRKRRGTLSPEAMRRLDQALLITLDLPGRDLPLR